MSVDVLANPARCRKPTIMDGLILIAATAVGLALIRTVDFWFRKAYPWFSLNRDNDWASVIGYRIEETSYVVLMWSIAFLPIRLCRPRPPLRDAARQPGLMACCAVGLALVFEAITSISERTGPYPTPGTYQWAYSLVASIVSNQNIAHSVLAAWMALRLTGAWQNEAGWIDRLGRALGVFWIASWLALTGLSLL